MSINIKLVHSWLVEAGLIAKEYFKASCKVELKGDSTFVTEADRVVEAFLVEKIETHYPEHGILAEEGTRNDGNEYTWVIDPIDGTSAFVWGIPTWCISIGVLKNWEPYFGLIYLPITEEIYVANERGDCFWNDQPIHASQTIDSSALLCLSPRTLHQYSVSFPGYVVSVASGILRNCLVARGVAVGAITIQPNIWDLAGIYPIVKAAGGDIRYISGDYFKLYDLIDGVSRLPLIVSHADIIEEIIATFSDIDRS